MTRFGLACGVSLAAFVLLGCGDDDDSAAKPDDEANEDAGSQSHGKPIPVPAKDAGDDESEGTFTLGDAGMRLVDCADAKDGSPCGPNGGLLCLAGSCVPSRCGDGYVDPALEECDDENTDSGDGCDADCGWTCADDSMCDDGAACNGKERCLVDHTCELGAPASDGTACTTEAISDGQCRQGTCTPVGCGDKEVKGTEQCDDGNDVKADGCEIDCTFSCEADADCDDGDMCTGAERCDTAAHRCIAGDELRCSDTSECTLDECDPASGCQYPLIDEDGDGYAPETLPCGDDCDDKRADVNPGHAEMCDEIDHDCDGDPMPKGTPIWYSDCDGDGYAGVNATREQACDMPAPTGACLSWTTRAPLPDDMASYDCNDGEPSAYPGQNGWFIEVAKGTDDYEFNCNSHIDLLYPNGGIANDAFCSGGLIGTNCAGPSGWLDKPPPCGEIAQYTRCGYAIGRDPGFNDCQRTYYDEQQKCR